MTASGQYQILPGAPLPLGTTFTRNGVQFSLFSRHARGVTLVLFQGDAPDSPAVEIALDPVVNRTGDIWHVVVRDLAEGQLYGYRIDGAYEPDQGHRYNRHKLLIDPYARALTGNFIWDITKCRGDDGVEGAMTIPSTVNSAPYLPKCVLVESRNERFAPIPEYPAQDHIIYELHVKGFTCHPSSGVAHPGTYRGLAEKIPYLKEMGVTAVELMPIQEFDELDNTNANPVTGERLKNFWGYNTIAFFAPKGSYAASGNIGEQVREFKEMIRAFHEAGIKVILDVVFNHTAEGDETGPTLSFRGIDNAIYYILEGDLRRYQNFSGCGNTVNCNHPFVREFILDALRYWVLEMNVDGFRFDLASILGRDQSGHILANPPLIERIGEDPILRNTIIIAEAWDAAGAYQVGSFPGRWAEWNGKFRDDIRKFWRGDRGCTGYFATRVTGSSDLYQHSYWGPLRSINFITCHDGFTLNDLVSYNCKHNIENGEENRDGESNNYSGNLGLEGPAPTRFLDAIRERQMKNFIATLFLSQGIPMLLAGDEIRRTQRGNNNSYCQDNEISWIDWGLTEAHAGMLRFTRGMIRFRQAHPSLRRTSFFTGEQAPGRPAPDISWHGCSPGAPDWSERSHAVALLLCGDYAEHATGGPDNDIYAVFNAGMITRPFTVPPAPSGRPWRLAADTAASSPDDLFEPGTEPIIEGNRYMVKKLSVAILIA